MKAFANWKNTLQMPLLLFLQVISSFTVVHLVTADCQAH